MARGKYSPHILYRESGSLGNKNRKLNGLYSFVAGLTPAIMLAVMEMLNRLTIATFNRGKLLEYRYLLNSLPISLKGLDSFENVAEVEETGSTFEANARLKASAYALQTGTPTLADDSGLIVDALNGRPGVLSARYGREGTRFAEKMTLLLDELRAVENGGRSARFECSIVVAAADGGIMCTARGVCHGTIALAPAGTGGFGYDPIFVPDGFVQTFAELAADVKHQISHRARAFAQIIPYLRDNKVV